MEELEVDKSYSYDHISNLCKGSRMDDYGPELIGRNAIHFQDEKGLDYWFILDGASGNKYYYKCVYKG